MSNATSEKTCQTKDKVLKTDSINNGLLIVPTNVRKMKTIPTSHKRMGSTGTTGDESYTTDDEDDIDDPDFDVNNHKQTDFYTNGFGSYSGISTITDKIGHGSLMHRNSSDISVYSALDKCSDESENLDGSSSLVETEVVSDCLCDTVDWAKPTSVENVDKFTFTELKTSLKQAHQQLKARKEEIRKLGRMKQEVEGELEDLTASLFQEAHNMVREANEKQASAERALRESEMKVEVLMAEVAALKTLVLTSTPSSPNPHLHPQIDKTKEESVVIFSKKHSRSPSHSHLKYGRGDSPSSRNDDLQTCESEQQEYSDIEIDPIFHDEFLTWKEKPIFDKTSAFIARVYEEDINLCLAFANEELSQKVAEAVEKGIILIEACGEKHKTFPRDCALMNVSRICSHRMNIGDNGATWYNISQICRNRITAVCDFLNYLKYIERGLVKSSAQDIYYEVIRLRRNITLGRLGFHTKS